MSGPTQAEMAQGHLWTISASYFGVGRISGRSTYRQTDWPSEPISVQVRAHSLIEAVRKAADLPFAEWARSMPDDDASSVE